MFHESSTRPPPDRIDRYEIAGLLGTGSFAAVYLADDPAFDAPVALKVLGDHHSAVPEIRERFVNEARTLRRLASDRIVAVFDIGEWQGQPYVVMEALVGGTLEHRLSLVEPTRDDVVRLISELGACLQSAHSGGVVHRDIKPSNLLIRSGGAPDDARTSGDDAEVTELIGADERLVLADFGLARALGLTTLTVAGGTDGFMAPEQRVPSTTVDERADIFAATAVVTQALKGSISDELVDVMRASADPVDQALARGLSDRPDDRYPDADTWVQALTGALRADESDHPTQPHDSTHRSSAMINRGADVSRRSRFAAIVLVIVVALALVATGAVIIGRSDDEGTTAGSAGEADLGQTATDAAVSEIAAFAGGWSTKGSAIVDSLGNPIALRGVSWIGFDSDSFVAQGLWARNWKDLVDLVAELGFNTIRLPFSSAMLDPGTMPTSIDEQLNPDLIGLTSLEVMDLIVDYSATKGLAVVLERHTLSADGGSALWYDDTYSQDRFIADWESLASRYAASPNVVGADLADAPHQAACWGCGDETVDWKLAAEQAGNAIHGLAPEWLIFVAGVEQVNGAGCGAGGAITCGAWGADLRGAMTNPVQLDASSSNKVVYSSQEFGPSLFRQSWFDDPEFPTNMPALWDGWWGELERQDSAPVVIDSVGAPLDDEFDRVWLDALLAHVDERDAGFAYWTLNPNLDGTGLLGDDWNTVDEEKMAALRPYLSGPFE
jgi:endoglucanase